jgi:hypothetical protein
MFGSAALDVAIGAIFFFLFVSLMCSAIREGIESVLKMRALDLERGIREILNDPKGETTAGQFFSHPLISSLFLGKYEADKLKVSRATVFMGTQMHMPLSARRNLPSYIPSANFVQALLDLAARGPLTGNASAPVPQAPFTATDIRAGIARIQNEKVERAILSAFDTAKDELDGAKANLEAWFNSAMDRVSGWYKRRTQLYLFAIGFLVAAGLNLDTINVTRHLIEDKSFRDLVVAQAEATAKSGLPAPDYAKQREALSSLGFPMGWPADQAKACAIADGDPAAPPTAETLCWKGWSLPQMIVGWLVTAIAVIFGAPFWFDLLNKLVALRSSGKDTDEKKEGKAKG